METAFILDTLWKFLWFFIGALVIKHFIISAIDEKLNQYFSNNKTNIDLKKAEEYLNMLYDECETKTGSVYQYRYDGATSILKYIGVNVYRNGRLHKLD